MLPVIEIPSFIRDFISSFSLSHHSRKHMARYVTGLIASSNKTIKGIGAIFLDKLSNKALNRFFSEYQWDEKKLIYPSFKSCRSTMKQDGVNMEY